MTETNAFAKKLFAENYNCAETSLMAISKHYNVVSDLIPRIATGFGSGIAETDGPCGAITGAVIAINLILGRNNPAGSKDNCYAAAKEFVVNFENEFGCKSCFSLTGCDKNTEEGKKNFALPERKTKCEGFVIYAVETAIKSIDKFQKN